MPGPAIPRHDSITGGLLATVGRTPWCFFISVCASVRPATSLGSGRRFRFSAHTCVSVQTLRQPCTAERQYAIPSALYELFHSLCQAQLSLGMIRQPAVYSRPSAKHLGASPYLCVRASALRLPLDLVAAFDSAHTLAFPCKRFDNRVPPNDNTRFLPLSTSSFTLCARPSYPLA